MILLGCEALRACRWEVAFEGTLHAEDSRYIARLPMPAAWGGRQ
jgi:hypothetical protein